MNKFSKFLFLGALSFGLWSCSADEPGKDSGTVGDGTTKYLSVRIVSTDDASTRANYEDGENNTKENTVNKVRFYFFDTDGHPVKANKDNGVSKHYFDWENPKAAGTVSGDNVDKKLEAVIVINTEKGDLLPAQLFAVANPPETSAVGDQNMTLSSLRNKYHNYADMAKTGDSQKFVMVNSVYMKDGQVISATPLAVTDFRTTEQAAKDNPVVIYIERNVAKVRAQISNDVEFMAGTTNIIKAKIKPETDDAVAQDLMIYTDESASELQNVYVKINGWQVTSYMPAANLSKHIDTGWQTSEIFPSLPSDLTSWNSASRFRSYWAKANDIGGASHVNISYKSINLPFAATSKTYVNENAERPVEGVDPTRIIVSATLCKQDGTALDVCEYKGIKFVDNESLTGLRNNVLLYCQKSGHTHFRQNGTDADGKALWVEMGINDITFEQNNGDNVENKKYEVIAKLTTTAMGYTWRKYDSENANHDINNPDTWEACTAQEINTCMSQHKAKIYKGGNSYYFAEIKHFGRNGVVRNHIYDINVKGFYGLGTPVYDPNWAIEPEKTQEEDAYLAAEIQMLSWRLVENDIIFDSVQ